MKILKLFALAAVVVFAVGLARSAGPDIYPDPSHARPDIAAALKDAAATHRRVILDFGGNWCGDCRVLDIYMHDEKNKPLVDANFVVVHVNVGHFDANQDIAEQYDIPLKRGVPALAILSDHGKLLFSQKSGEFESMRHLESSSLTDFLVHWRPERPGCSAVTVNC